MRDGTDLQQKIMSAPFFVGLPDEAVIRATAHMVTRSHPADQVILLENDWGNSVYFILEGWAKIRTYNLDGKEITLNILGFGEMFGEMGVLDDSPRSASVVAVSPSDLVTIAKTDFKRLMQDNFELAWHVMCNLTRRLRDADRKIESLALMDVYGRVARLLLEMSEEVDGLKMVKKKISKQDIAKMIGASREMVSRVMKDLGLRGLIEETDGGVILREKIYDL